MLFSGDLQNISRGIRHPSPAAWAEDFHRWALKSCVYRDRWFSGIAALHKDFRDWCLNRDEVPCSVTTFERLLLGAGFLLADGLMSGLTLKADWESYESSKMARDTENDRVPIGQRGERSL